MKSVIETNGAVYEEKVKVVNVVRSNKRRISK